MTAENTEQNTDAGQEPEVTEAESQQNEQPGQAGNPNAEAAKYRRKLRDTETALTEAQTKVATQDQRINSLQRKLIDQHTGPHLHNADDFWKFADVELADLLDDEGLPNIQKVDEALNAMLEERAYLKNLRVPQPDPSAGPSGNPGAQTDSVESFLKERLG